MPYDLIFAATDFLNGESGGIKSIFKLIGLIIICILIIAASYFTTRFVGKRQLAGGAGSNIRSIDIFRVNQNKYLQIIEIGERYFCIAVTKDNISLICELSREDIKKFPQTGEGKSFKECMSMLMKKKNGTESGEKFPEFNKIDQNNEKNEEK